MKLTKKLLKQLHACSSGIEFCERYKLFGFPLERLDEIRGDYDGFVEWLKSKTNLEFDQNQNLVRKETSLGWWAKSEYEYDQNGNMILQEYSDGWWKKFEYDQNNNQILREDSNGSLVKYEYDQNQNLVQREDFNGSLKKFGSEFYDNGQLKRIGGLVIPYFEQEI